MQPVVLEHNLDLPATSFPSNEYTWPVPRVTSASSRVSAVTNETYAKNVSLRLASGLEVLQTENWRYSHD
jgi:hypothetical protein